MCVVVVRHVGIAPVGLRAFGQLSRHRHSNHFQPALLELLRIGSKVVGGLGLGEAEAGRGVRGPSAVIHTVAQQGDSALGLHVLKGGQSGMKRVSSICMHRFINSYGESNVSLHVLLMLYLRSAVEIEHQTLLLGDDAPHLLPRFVLLTVLQ